MRLGTQKGVGWLLALLVACAPLHFCPPTYERPNGLSCVECAALPDSTSTEKTFEAPHGDCHDCCSLKSCDEPSPADGLLAAKQMVVLAVMPVIESFEPVSLPVAQVAVPVLIECCPPNGPPTKASTRAPPAFLV